MDHFPSACEFIAASALLLLSSQCQLCVLKEKEQLLTREKSEQSADAVDSFLSTNSKSSSSTASMITDHESSPEKIERRRTRNSSSIVARYSEMRLKVARKSRSNSYLICNIKHNSPVHMAKPVTAASSESAQDAVSEVSCLSVCSGPSHEEITKNMKKKVGPGHLWRRAEAILRFLECGGCASEVRIRQVLGDSPDTSKALRTLLKLEKIERSGGGGRSDPYIYKVK
uniref:HTH three-helical bundle domain-containing protein n=1 Tax=Kalanchoe fedtschenkoi TaxID=63787 RepID=A0A7N0TDD2_KALFE